MGIFKAYDIRGKYSKELNETQARQIGIALAKYLDSRDIVVGYDMRESAPAIYKAFTEGVTACGVNVVAIGRVSTPMVSFTVGHYGYGAGVMITASHNPKEYIGFKVCKKDVVPVGYDNGLDEVERMVQKGVAAPAGAKGDIEDKDVWKEYRRHVRKQAKLELLKPLKIVVDAGSGMGGYVFSRVFDETPLNVVPLYFEPDGSFPYHEPNPLKSENMRDLQKEVLAQKAQIGLAFDGDADRVMFVDEKGQIISSDMVTILIGKTMLEQYPGSRILYDLRSSRAVKEDLEKMGASTGMSRVGHAFIKRQLREENGIFAGELSGHYYFKCNYYADSGMIAALFTLLALSESSEPLSEMIRPHRRYFCSGEINTEVEDPDAKIEELSSVHKSADQSRLDGLTISYPEWWFNLRKSNTEPILRLNLEADNKAIGEQRLREVLSLVRK